MKKAAVMAGIKKNGHPHTMRTSAITQTGHASTQMMNRYDKISQAENASRIALV
jgi:hypothetical protein